MNKLENCPRCCKRVHIVPSIETLATDDRITMYRRKVEHVDRDSRCNETNPFINATSFEDAVGAMGDTLAKTWNAFVADYPEARVIGITVPETLLDAVRDAPGNDRVKSCVALIETTDPAEPFRVMVSGGDVGDDTLGRLLCRGWAAWMQRFEAEAGVEFEHCRFCGKVVREDDRLKSTTPIHRSCAVKRAYLLTPPEPRADGAQIFLAALDVPLTCEICGERMTTNEAIEPLLEGELSPRCHSACKHPHHRARTEPENPR